MDKETVARRIKRRNSVFKIRVFHDLSEMLTEAPAYMNKLFLVHKEFNVKFDVREKVKSRYNIGYMAYFKCLEIQGEYSEFIPESSLSDLEEAKKRLDLRYIETAKKLRSIQNGR